MGINKILKNNIHPNVDILSHFHQYMSYICSLRSSNPLFPLFTKSASKSEQCHAMLSMVFSAKSKEFQQLNSIYTCPQVHFSTNIEIYFSWKLEFLFKRFRENICRNRILIFCFVLMISQFVDHIHAISTLVF